MHVVRNVARSGTQHERWSRCSDSPPQKPLILGGPSRWCGGQAGPNRRGGCGETNGGKFPESLSRRTQRLLRARHCSGHSGMIRRACCGWMRSLTLSRFGRARLWQHDAESKTCSGIDSPVRALSARSLLAAISSIYAPTRSRDPLRSISILRH